MPEEDLGEHLREELTAASWDERAQDMLLTVGLLAFGVALGVKWAAVDTINHLARTNVLGFDAPALASIYNHHMLVALALAAVGLVGAVYLEKRRDRQ